MKTKQRKPLDVKAWAMIGPRGRLLDLDTKKKNVGVSLGRWSNEIVRVRVTEIVRGRRTKRAGKARRR